ncbi:acetyltransferase [Dasania marina]|uniref:acetyltransferase n=1 Tax=Dasania marina TaxID=471499 RepID=UPI0030DAC925|tara:strand:- start:53204 stop:53851 length:648 start_codon:yes stop_codon:yes gene_type:complete
MNNPVVILGGGGHASVLMDILQITGREIIGVVDPALVKGSVLSNGVKVLGDDQEIMTYTANDIELVNGVGSLPGQMLRKSLYQKYQQLGYHFTTLIHPSATIAQAVRLAEGVQLMAGTVVQTGSAIGANTIINTRASVDHDCVIAEHCHIAPGAVLCGDVVIAASVHVGPGATIIQGLSLDEGVTVAAGAVVTKNLCANTIVFPALGSSKMKQDK